MPLSSKSSGSFSPLSTTPSLDQPVDDGVPSPGTAEDYGDIYMGDIIPGDATTPTDNNVYDRKGKGKARQRSQSRTPRLKPLNVDPDVLDIAAKEAYLSPPLTSSDHFLLGVQNISRVLRRGLSSIDFDVDLDLQSEGSSSPPSSPGGHPDSSSSAVEDEGEGEAIVAVAASELSLGEEEVDESSILTPSDPSEAESSRNATAGDTTLQDVGSVIPAVRFPSIFTQDMSSLESSRTGTPISPPLAVSVPRDVDHPRRQFAKESGDGILVHRRQTVVAKGKKRVAWRRRRLKIQEKGLTRDFLLIITLCFGLACAGILIVRPTIMALYGYDTLGGRLELDID